ncbi:hypothetical protein [Nucisporomicrobium flavum]|uniref:hypothetical protein n=1 Tax=Nucisporomicrobium flavum TaxID=2785915 RepID=UPI0018F4D3D2|nr:hypothetical protein [Nucisporomicrobium flavum]
METPHRYYVSFVRPSDTGSQFGAAEVALMYPVRSKADIDTIGGILADAGYPGVTVLSFSPFTSPAAQPQAA